MPGLDGWSTAAKAQLAGSVVRGVIFLRIDATPVLRLCSGVGDFPIPADIIEPAAAVYSGMGELVGIGAVSQLINGLADRAEFTVGGVPSSALLAAVEGAGIVKGADCTLGYAVLGEDLQLLSPLAWLWDGVADVVTPSRTSDQDGQPVRSITISVGTPFTGRKRSRMGFWTDAQQTRRSPDDRFCSYVASLTRGTTVRFKPRS